MTPDHLEKEGIFIPDMSDAQGTTLCMEIGRRYGGGAGCSVLPDGVFVYPELGEMRLQIAETIAKEMGFETRRVRRSVLNNVTPVQDTVGNLVPFPDGKRD